MSSNLPTCCGYLAKSGKKADYSGTMIYAVWCETCGRKGTGPTPEQARAMFDKSSSTAIANKIAPNRPPVRFDAAHVAEFVAENAVELSSIVAPFVRADRPLFDRMVKKNVRYVMGLKGNSWAKVWASEDGRESIKDALDEAFMLGVTLPDMGCMVPFGDVCEFIPDVEAYRFAVTTGSSAPFRNLEIEPIFDKDQYRITRKDGAFALEFTSILAERGDVKAIAVYGTNRAGKQIGEIYPVSRLIEKARTHSQSYRSYLQDIQAFEVAKQEGKLLRDANGREYIIKSVDNKYGNKFAMQDAALFAQAEKDGKLKKDGVGDYVEKTIPGKGDRPAWTKKVYRSEIENPGTETCKVYLDELSNPYDSADRPEMLRKLAGKSFLAPYIKTRNSTAAIEELSESDDVNDLLDKALGQAFDAFDDAPREEAPEPADLAPPPAKVPSKKAEKVTVPVEAPSAEEEGEGLF